MKLASARVQNFRLIDDTGDFRIGPLTCLVGKNESGKTAVLQALHRINPDDPDQKNFNVELEYPRHKLFEYRARHPDDPDRVVHTEWTLEKADLRAIEEDFGTDVVTSTQVVVTRGYENVTRWGVNVDELRAIKNLIDSSELDESAKAVLNGSASTARELFDQASALEATPQRDSFVAHLSGIGITTDGTTIAGLVRRHLVQRLPTLVYYSNYDRLPGEVSMTELTQLEQSGQLGFPQKIFKALLSLAGTNPEAISSTATFEGLKASLEAVGLRLSREIFEYWSQNRDLEVDFTFDAARPGDKPPLNEGFVFRTRIKNKRHGSSVSFNERSTGFVWFFSFLVWFSQMKREHGNRLVLLLDEPGLSLHGTAQADLLRYMKEKLVPQYQVVYTTHSPFLVDPEDLLSVRTVEDASAPDGAVLGTKVGDEVLSTDAETLFPLRAALGYDVTQTMFIGEHCLLVEGPSDLLYFHWAAEELRNRSRPSLDRRWTITPCGGIRKVGSFLSLFGANHLQTAVFTDFAAGDKSELTSLRSRGLLEASRVLSADMFVTGQQEADIEDVLGREVYVELVNAAYNLGPEQRLSAVKPDGAPERVVKEVEDAFKLLPSSIPEFDHFVPARFLTENRQQFESLHGIEDSLQRFEAIFAKLNAFL
jgi:predicted ATP-dependent endonuclease of OLD family